MKLRPSRPSHATVVAYAALFVALGGTAAANRHLLIGGGDIRAHSIKSRQLGHGSVTAGALARGAVTASALAPGSVGSPALQGGAIPQSALSSSLQSTLRALSQQIDGARIKDQTISAGKLAPEAVTDEAVAAGSLTGDKLAPGTITNSDLSSDVTAKARGWQLVEVTSSRQVTTYQVDTALCPTGTQVVGGGVAPGVTSTNPGLDAAQNSPQFVFFSRPEINSDGSSGWTAAMVWPNAGQNYGGWDILVDAICVQTPPRVGFTAP